MPRPERAEQARRLRAAREKAGLTQLQVGQHVGVSRAAVSAWESPTGASPSAHHFDLLVRLYGVPRALLRSDADAAEVTGHLEPEPVPESDAQTAALRRYRVRVHSYILALVEAGVRDQHVEFLRATLLSRDVMQLVLPAPLAGRAHSEQVTDAAIAALVEQVCTPLLRSWGYVL